MNRHRATSKALWGAAAGALTAGFAYRAYRQGLLRSSDPSLDVWRDFDSRKHSHIVRLISAAVLAASPHNSQPWRFSVSENQVLVHADFARKLGAMDPFEREMFIGLGCALENMAIAAPGVGLITEIVLLPESTRELAARVLLKRAEVSPHRLEMAIPKRRTHRGAYEISQQISPDTIRLLQDEVGAEHFRLVFLAAESAEAAGFIELTVEATQDIIGDRAMAHDSARWYRQNQTQIARARDGLTMQTQGLPSWLATTALLMPKAPEYVTHRMWLKNTRDVQLPTAARFGMIVVPRAHFFDDATSLRVGRAWQRLHLAATLLGLACQPMNQIPERISREHQLGCEPRMRRAAEERFQLDGELPTFCFRIGRSLREPPHSPRRAAEMVMN